MIFDTAALGWYSYFVWHVNCAIKIVSKRYSVLVGPIRRSVQLRTQKTRWWNCGDMKFKRTDALGFFVSCFFVIIPDSLISQLRTSRISIFFYLPIILSCDQKNYRRELTIFTFTVRLPLQSATPPHWVNSPMAVRAIPASARRRRIARQLPNRIQIIPSFHGLVVSRK